MATETGIIMLVYLREAIDKRGGLENIQSLEELRQAVIEGPVHRLRAKLLPERVAVIARFPHGARSRRPTPPGETRREIGKKPRRRGRRCGRSRVAGRSGSGGWSAHTRTGCRSCASDWIFSRPPRLSIASRR